MGAAVSVGKSRLPDTPYLTEDVCRSVLGDLFSKTAFDRHKGEDGTISRANVLLLLSQTDVFLTHDWGRELGQDNHARVSQVNRALQDKGLVTWFDDEQMQGNIKSQMTAGIDRTKCVIVFITRRYVEKVMGENAEDNCQLEFHYASMRKTAAKMVPVVMEERMLNARNWDGPVGMVLGPRLYVDMSGDLSNSDYLEQKIDELYAAVRRVVGATVREEDGLSNAAGAVAPKIASSSSGGGGGKGSGHGHGSSGTPLTKLTVEQVGALMDRLNLSVFRAGFEQNQVDGATLALFSEEGDLRDLGMAELPKVKVRLLFTKLAELKMGVDASLLSTPASTGPAPSSSTASSSPAPNKPFQVVLATLDEASIPIPFKEVPLGTRPFRIVVTSPYEDGGTYDHLPQEFNPDFYVKDGYALLWYRERNGVCGQWRTVSESSYDMIGGMATPRDSAARYPKEHVKVKDKYTKEGLEAGYSMEFYFCPKKLIIHKGKDDDEGTYLQHPEPYCCDIYIRENDPDKDYPKAIYWYNEADSPGKGHWRTSCGPNSKVTSADPNSESLGSGWYYPKFYCLIENKFERKFGDGYDIEFIW